MKTWMIPAQDDEAGWRRLLFSGVLLTLIAYALKAFLQPHSLHWDPLAIQDDARQFLTWTPRLLDPLAMKGDLQADYWYSASPALYRLPFEILAAIGVPPTVTGRLLPLILIPLLALASWPLALRLTGRASFAFLASALVVITVIHEDSIYSGTPRAFAEPLILVFLGGLVLDKPVRVLAGIGLLAFIYPAPAITCLGLLGLSRIRLSNQPGLDLSWRSIMTVGAAILLVGAAGLSLRAEIGQWKPSITWEQAKATPAMISPQGRSTIVQRDGSIGWVSGPRLGFLPPIAKNRKSTFDPGAIANIALFLPMLFLAARSLRRRIPEDPERIYALAVTAALICWTIAFMVAFKLHLPSRYSRSLLEPLEALALAQVIGLLLLRMPAKTMRMIGALSAPLLIVGFLQSHLLVRPLDRGGIAAIAALPREARVAGIDEDLNLAAALTGRSILASTEQAIPYQLGYYGPFHERLSASVTALRSANPADIAGFIRHYGVTAIAIDPDILSAGQLPETYAKALPELPVETGAPLALGAAPDQCLIYKGKHTLLFNAPCLLQWTETKKKM